MTKDPGQEFPPVDIYRLPLVEPLGHLVLQASWFENALIEFVALLLPFGPRTLAEDVAQKLRNWDADFLGDSVATAIADHELADDLIKFFKWVEELRKRRHRMVHDAIEVGLTGDQASGYGAALLREGFQRDDRGRTVRTCDLLAPEDVALVAWAFFDLRMELDTFWGRVNSPTT
jgi:hypothetical protein